MRYAFSILAPVLPLALVACGGAEATSQGANEGGDAPFAPTPVPADADARHAVLHDAGERIHGALLAGQPERLLADDVQLRALVDSEAATRYTATRLGLGARLADVELALLEGTEYQGICVQGARLEPAGGSLGLVADGWVFDRALVMGTQPGGRRIAAWVEGTFVSTPEGFVAIDLSRVEDPRWEHSDLEIAPCDMEEGIR